MGLKVHHDGFKLANIKLMVHLQESLDAPQILGSLMIFNDFWKYLAISMIS